VVWALAGVAWGANLPASEQPNRKYVFTLEEFCQEVRARNPQLIAAYKNYESAKAVPPQVLAPNNPQVGIIQMQAEGQPEYTLSQSFPFPGKKRLAAAVADSQAKSLGFQADSLRLQLIAQAKTQFFQLLSLERQYEVNEESIQRLEQMKRVTQVRYAQNAAAFVDYLNAQVAQSSAETNRFALQRQIDTTRATLNTLIGRDPGSPLEILGSIPDSRMIQIPLRRLKDLALAYNPAIRAGLYQVKSAEDSVKLARLGYYPDFNVVGSLVSNQAPFFFTPVNGYGIELDVILPVWFWRKEKYGVDQAKYAYDASQATQLSLVQQTELAVESAYNALAQAVKQVDFIRTRQLEEARAAYRLALTNYESGTTPFVNLLTAQDTLRTTQLALAQGEANAAQAYAGLIAAIGVDPMTLPLSEGAHEEVRRAQKVRSP
jgi:cobalt-zinc-cadmium efflux system outer membrane protein